MAVCLSPRPDFPSGASPPVRLATGSSLSCLSSCMYYWCVLCLLQLSLLPVRFTYIKSPKPSQTDDRPEVQWMSMNRASVGLSWITFTITHVLLILMFVVTGYPQWTYQRLGNVPPLFLVGCPFVLCMLSRVAKTSVLALFMCLHVCWLLTRMWM